MSQGAHRFLLILPPRGPQGLLQVPPLSPFLQAPEGARPPGHPHKRERLLGLPPEPSPAAPTLFLHPWVLGAPQLSPKGERGEGAGGSAPSSPRWSLRCQDRAPHFSRGGAAPPSLPTPAMGPAIATAPSHGRCPQSPSRACRVVPGSHWCHPLFGVWGVLPGGLGRGQGRPPRSREQRQVWAAQP